MGLKTELVASGFSNLQASMLGVDGLQAVTSAGSTQATAVVLPGSYCTVAGTGGVLLPPTAGSGMVVLVPAGISTVYPQLGEQINVLTAGTGLALAAGRPVILIPSAGRWAAISSAL
jgi:hypothetical protein